MFLLQGAFAMWQQAKAEWWTTPDPVWGITPKEMVDAASTIQAAHSRSAPPSPAATQESEGNRMSNKCTFASSSSNAVASNAGAGSLHITTAMSGGSNTCAKRRRVGAEPQASTALTDISPADDFAEWLRQIGADQHCTTETAGATPADDFDEWMRQML